MNKHIAPTQFAPTLPKTLTSLATLLLHRELWPEGFEWNFADPSYCAMGLTRRYWGDHRSVADIFYLSSDEAYFIFGIRSYEKPKEVTPEMVAERMLEYA